MQVDTEIKRQIINGCRSIKLKEKILEKAGITLKEILTTAGTGEAAREQAKAIEGGTLDIKGKPEPVSAIGKAPVVRKFDKKNLRKTKMIKRVIPFM